MLEMIQEVDLAKNAVKKLRGYPTLMHFRDLWLNDNQVDDIEEVRNLAAFPALKAIYLERNPFHGLGDAAMEQRYKAAILDAVPNIAQIDADRLNFTINVITDGTE